MSGSGTGDLMDAILEALPAETSAQYEDDLPRITIVGRPNVGKSSLTNALLGVERNIVTPVAGTTRDSIHTRYNKFGMDFYLVDTAGMRKKGKVTEDLEFYSVMRSIRAIENSDVCVLMLDAEQGLESQDLNIHNLIVRNRKGCVIVVNKWDLIEKGNNTMKEWREFLMKKLAPFNDIPIIFTSVLNKQRILEVLQTAVHVFQSRKRRIPTSEFNDYILPVIEETPPPSTKGKYIRIKYAMQLPTPTPQFAFFVNLPQYIKEPYRRFLENKIREQWDFSGVPMQLYFRRSNSRRNPRFDIPSEPAFAGAARGFRCGASALRKRVRSAGDTGDKGRLFFRRPHAVVFPGEVTAGEILVSTFPPNLPLPALRAASVAAPRHSASGCARLATRVTKGGFFSASPCSCIFGRSNSRRNPRFDIPSEPAFAGAARGFRCGASAPRKRVRSADDTGDKGRLFPASSCRRISERNNSRRNPFPDIHEPSSCQKTGFAAAATSVASTHNDTGKSEKTIRTLVFSHETPYLYPQG